MFVILFLLIAVVNFGKGITYRLDNIFITLSVVYLILPSTNIVLNNESYNAYDFMYGFSWSCGLELFFTANCVTTSTNLLPSMFIQQTYNNAQSLLFVDDNVIRNGWSAILLMLTIAVLWMMMYLATKILTQNSIFSDRYKK